jgi:hypothetical protein
MTIELSVIVVLLIASLLIVRQLNSTAAVRARLRNARTHRRGARRLDGR